jgi:predicted permease
MWSDAHYAIRSLRRQPAFAATAFLTFALGIGATTAIFSVLYGVLVRPLPYPGPEQLVRLSEAHPGANAPLGAAFISDLTLQTWAPNARTVQAIAGYSPRMYTVGEHDPVRYQGAAVGPALFSVLGVAPAAGRFFDPGEAVEGASQVVVIAHRYWREQLGADPAALGRTLMLDGRAHVIIGVAPTGFAFPDTDASLWTPYVFPTRSGDPNQRGLAVLFAIARLAAGVTPEQASAEGTSAARSVTRPFVAEMMFGKGGPVEVRARPLIDELTTTIRPALVVLGIAVMLVLLIACANVANLTLARGVVRQRELAVRAALGAGRSRLLRQLLTESLVTAAAGGAAGVALAWATVRALPAIAPASFPRVEDVRLDGVALAFAVAAVVVSGLLAGVLPAIRGSFGAIAAAMHDGGFRSTSSTARRVRSGLLAVEAAVAVMLLVGAGLLVRSFVRLTSVDGGFDRAEVLTAQIHVPDGPDRDARNAALLEALLPRLEQVPGVTSAGAANMAPFGNSTAIAGFSLGPPGPDGQRVMARANAWVVTPGLARTLGLRVREGHFPTRADAGPRVEPMAVNQEFARLYLSDGKPIVGRRYPRLKTDRDVETVIVGVVDNVLKDGLDRQPQPEIFRVPERAAGINRQIFLAVRTAGDPTAIVPELRRLLREAEPRAAIDGIGTLESKLSTAVAQPRFAASVLVGFAGAALLLAAVGLYGVLSYNVSQRRRELGVRAAVGASRGQLVALIVREGLGVVTLGLAAGLVGAAALTGFMQRLLFGVTPLDPWSFAGAPAVLLVVALAACLVPARRASRTDPAEVLRSE